MYTRPLDDFDIARESGPLKFVRRFDYHDHDTCSYRFEPLIGLTAVAETAPLETRPKLLIPFVTARRVFIALMARRAMGLLSSRGFGTRVASTEPRAQASGIFGVLPRAA